MLPDHPNDVLFLPVAAAIAYKRLFSTRHDRRVGPSTDELDLVALVLSSHLAIYGVRAPGDKRARISEPELLEGMFWGGAARFESRHRVGVVSQLTVRKSDLDRVLDELKIGIRTF